MRARGTWTASRKRLVARRTLAWLDNQVWGDATLLTALWDASVTAEPARVTVGGDVAVAVRNASAIDLDVRALSLPAWLTLGDGVLARESTTVLKGRAGANAPTGTHAIEARLQVHNLHARPATPLAATLPLRSRSTRAASASNGGHVWLDDDR